MENSENFKILIAEDNFINQKLIGLMMKASGYEFDMVSNGLEAFELYKKHNYRLIFMDLQMPVMDGLEATRQIRQYEETASILNPACIIAVTANNISERIDECSEVGITEFLEKPFTAENLISLINKVRNLK
jgi:CheY-like chemotaxis protein